MKKAIVSLLTASSLAMVGTPLLSNMNQTMVPTSINEAQAATATYSECQIYKGVSSASTTRIHVTSRYKILATPSKKVKISIFRYGKLVRSVYPTKRTTYTYSGSGDYSVRVYNNTAKTLACGISIQAIK